MKLKKMLVGCLCMMAMASCGEGNQNVKEETTMEEGKNAVQMITAVYRSSETGRPIVLA